MKKILVVSLGALLLLSSCGTYTGTGAYVGGSFGSIIGSAVGGIAGGWRGSDIGSLIGLAGGAAVGAAIGSAADKAEQQKYEEYRNARDQRRVPVRPQYDNRGNDDSGFDQTNSGDDRLYGFGEDFSTVDEMHISTLEMRSNPLEIRNAHLIDATRDGMLSRGEEIRMVFEIYNNSQKPVFQVLPMVSEITGNKHIHVSENVLVESIMPGRGIRYTAVIKADNRLKNGEAVIRIGVLHQNKEVASQSREFPIQTIK